ncbi:MAG: hypothetical protein WBL63_11300 [Candidatus Acidiferrum sp.]
MLHRNRVVGVTCNVPARAIPTAGEERATAGHILFGSQRVDLIFDFVTFFGKREKAKTVNRTLGRTQLGEPEANFIPGKVSEIEKQKAGKNQE